MIQRCGDEDEDAERGFKPFCPCDGLFKFPFIRRN